MNGRPNGEGEREFSQVACSCPPASWRNGTALFVTRLSAKLHTNCCLITAPDLPTDRCPLPWRHFLRTGTPTTNLPCSERHLTAHRAPSTLDHSLSIHLKGFFLLLGTVLGKFCFSRTLCDKSPTALSFNDYLLVMAPCVVVCDTAASTTAAAGICSRWQIPANGRGPSLVTIALFGFPRAWALSACDRTQWAQLQVGRVTFAGAAALNQTGSHRDSAPLFAFAYKQCQQRLDPIIGSWSSWIMAAAGCVIQRALALGPCTGHFPSRHRHSGMTCLSRLRSLVCN